MDKEELERVIRNLPDRRTDGRVEIERKEDIVIKREKPKSGPFKIDM